MSFSESTPSARSSSGSAPRPAPLAAVLGITFFGSVSNGAFSAGLFFVTAGHYHFSPLRNLVLGALMGAIGAISARASARVSGLISGGSAPRAVLRGALASWSLLALLPVLFPASETVLWASALGGSCTCSLLWPVVESYLTAGRHGSEMRAAIGWFNVVWTPAMAVALLVLPLFARAGLTLSLGLATLTNVVALAISAALPRRPAPHEPEAATAAIGREYSWLVRSASWLLPASYVISATLAPVLPHRLAAVGVGAPASLLAASWMAARFVTLFVMWRTGFWHGRWGTLAAAGAALGGGLGLVLLARTPSLLVAGLITYGTGMGLTYYSALYYSMSVGRAAVEAGGKFEALVGLGSCVGPVLGLIGNLVAGPAHAGSATVVLTWCVAALASRGAVLPYVEARRRRSDPGDAI